MIEIIIISILTAFLAHFINYCIGKPGSKEFSPYEVFSIYTVWLSKRRLKEVGLYDEYSKQYHENIKRHETKPEVIQMKNDFKKMIYEAADPFFTWERAAGMCPVCFGFWLSLVIATLLSKNVVDLLTIIVVSHVSIRILSKII